MLNAISKIKNQHEREILDELFLQHYCAMYNRVLSIVKNKQDAEDVVANAVLSLFDKASFLQSLPPHKCAAYMVRTAKRQAFKYYKARRRKSVTALDAEMETLPAEVSIDPLELVCMRDRKREVGAALCKLSERDRLLLDCRYYENLSDQEIAALLAIDVQNVRKYMYIARRRALPLLKEALRDEQT